MAGSAAYSFRIQADGFNEFITSMRSLAQGNEAASASLEKLKNASPNLAVAMERAEQTASRQAQVLTGQVVPSYGRMVTAQDEVGRSTGRMGVVLQQGGYQVQDFFTQVSMGQNAMVAFSTQFAQLAGAFGAVGAIAGAAVTFGVVAAQMLGAGKSADELKEALDDQKALFDQATAAAERYREGISSTATSLNQLVEGYRAATEASRVFDQRRVENSQAALNNQRGALDNRILGGLDRNIASARGDFTQTDIASGLSFGPAVEGSRQVVGALEQARQALAAFRAETVPTADAVASLYNRLVSLAENAGTGRVEILQIAQALATAAPEYQRLAEAQAQAAQQFLAIRVAAGDSAERLTEYAQRLGAIGPAALAAARGLNALAQGGIGVAEDRITNEIARNEAILAAARAGGRTAGLAVQEGLERQEGIMRRAGELQRAYRAELVAGGKSGEELNELVNQSTSRFLQQATQAVTSGQAVENALERQARAARGARTDIGLLADAYTEFRRTASGLNSLGPIDDAIATRIQQQVRGTRQIVDREQTQRTQLELLQREGELIGLSADQRERELAALRARAGLVNRPGVTEAEIQAAQTLARATADQRAANTQLQNSWNELSRIGENAFSSVGQAITTAFSTGSLQALNFGNIARGVASSVVQSFAQLAILNPILNSVFGGTRGTLGGISSVAGLAGGGSVPVANADGTITPAASTSGGFSLNSLSSYASLGRNLFGGGGSTSFLTTPGAYANTGYGFVDSVLNTNLISPSAVAGSELGTVASHLPADFLAQNSGNVATTGGYSVGNAVGGAAAVAGGAYSIYSGIQKGGIGGGVGVVGGIAGVAGGAISAGVGAGLISASGTLAAFGPIGMIAAAVLAIVSALLPGEKPSGKGQSAIIDLATNAERFNGLGGSRYSAGNREEASRFATSVSAMETAIEKLVGFSLTGDVGAGVTSSRGDGPGNLYLRIRDQEAKFTYDESGAKAFAETAGNFLLTEFQKGASQAKSADVAAVLRNSATVEALGSNLEWYEGTYKQLTQALDRTTEFAESLRGLVKPYDDAIAKATELGLATETIEKKRGEALESALAPMLGITKASDAFGESLRALIVNYNATIAVAKDLDRPTADLDAARDQAVRDSFKPLLYGGEAASATTAYADGIKSITETYTSAIKVAKELGIATEGLVFGQTKAVEGFKKATAANYTAALRESEGQGYINQLAGVTSNWKASRGDLEAAGLDSGALYASQLNAVLKQLDGSQLDNVIAALDGADEYAVQFARQWKASLTTGGEAATATLRQLDDMANPIKAFAASMREVHDRFAAAVQSAQQLGHATGDLIAQRDKETGQLIAQRNATLGGIVEGLNIRSMKATGADGLATDLLGFDIGARSEAANLLAQLDGLGTTASETAAFMAVLERTQGEERLAIQKQYGEAAIDLEKQRVDAMLGQGQSIRNFIDQQRGTTASGASPIDALASARSVFDRDILLARGSDEDALGRITGQATTLLEAASAVFASGDVFQTMRDDVLTQLANLPATLGADASTAAKLGQPNEALTAAISGLAVTFTTPSASTDAWIASAARMEAQLERIFIRLGETSAATNANLTHIYDRLGEEVSETSGLRTDVRLARTAMASSGFV